MTVEPRTWIAVGAIAGLLAPIEARRLARDVATRVAGAAAGPSTTGWRSVSTKKPTEGASADV